MKVKITAVLLTDAQPAPNSMLGRWQPLNNSLLNKIINE